MTLRPCVPTESLTCGRSWGPWVGPPYAPDWRGSALITRGRGAPELRFHVFPHFQRVVIAEGADQRSAI